ncbi:hypothetical protein CDAR_457021 [Caerostris darwini]|uniref:Uncharacterized protein n=1 Tax=Caerostris darwini TaxID=1538125 RepID=A0AAV4Q041_9ARAC|nr:hypothetical protein CDAR_457021 [Caerostris darwini]
MLHDVRWSSKSRMVRRATVVEIGLSVRMSLRQEVTTFQPESLKYLCVGCTGWILHDVLWSTISWMLSRRNVVGKSLSVRMSLSVGLGVKGVL